MIKVLMKVCALCSFYVIFYVWKVRAYCLHFVRRKLITVTLSYANFYQGSNTTIDGLENLNIYLILK